MNNLLFLLMLAVMAAGYVLSEKRNQQGKPDQSHPLSTGVSQAQPTAAKWM